MNNPVYKSNKVYSTIVSEDVSYVYNAKIEKASIKVDSVFNVCFYIKFIYSEGVIEYELVLSNSNDDKVYLTPTDTQESKVLTTLSITRTNENFSEFITYLLNITESKSLDDMTDKYVKIGLDKYSGVVYIGNIIDNLWIHLKEFE